ncbi:MAG: GTPase [Acidimicrobiaceae bacterium]|nr:GTPase [Acidimicrobiaceae bacterium]MDQ1400136.1 GTPase [Acidimicrobiaceae bacterium]MDQ1414835.1 GTPase [Acidimicrobiaceae bacterium]
MSDTVRPPAVPVVAVVGRPNVGKSTLVNRIIGRRIAIVEERPGVTRDRKVLPAEWRGRAFSIVDTGGWLPGGSSLDHQVTAQAERAIKSADVILLVVDTTVGVTDEDARVAGILRRSGRPALVVANKVDANTRESDAWVFERLGLGDPIMVSALHGRGAGDLLDEVVDRLPPEATADEAGRPTAGTAGRADDEDHIISVAIVGRPNVGKSTLFNRLIGEERSVVHDLPGTTRDTIDTVVETPDGPIRFVDTAGLRRRAKESVGAEYYSLVRALQAIDHAEAALFVIDATEGVTHQDQRLAERVDGAGNPIVICLNKWELLDATQRAQVTTDIEDRLSFLSYAPVLKISALTGLGVHKLLPKLAASVEAYHRRVPTRELNKLIAEAQAAQASPGGRILYATQGATDPPTFTLFATRTIPPTYLRYLERRIREHFEFGPTPLKLRVRRRGA